MLREGEGLSECWALNLLPLRVVLATGGVCIHASVQMAVYRIDEGGRVDGCRRGSEPLDCQKMDRGKARHKCMHYMRPQSHVHNQA